MTNLEAVQNEVTVLGKYLFNKQVELPTTIKGCEALLESYYNLYGYTYYDACKAMGIEIKMTL